MIENLACTCHSYHSSSDGYAWYLLFRFLWDWLHWWSLPVYAAILGLFVWVRVWLGPDTSC